MFDGQPSELCPNAAISSQTSVGNAEPASTRHCSAAVPNAGSIDGYHLQSLSDSFLVDPSLSARFQ